MIKRSTIFSVAGLLLTGSLMAQVSVTTKLPATAVPGGNFTVELNVAKSDVSGFAKLQQQLPPGFTAEAGETANATFSFKDQKVKFLWMALPNDDFKVSYKVAVDASLSGNQIIEGTFAYIKDNETEKLVIPKDIITIQADQADAAKQAAMDKILAEQQAKIDAANVARELHAAEAQQEEAQQEEAQQEEAQQEEAQQEEVVTETEVVEPAAKVEPPTETATEPAAEAKVEEAAEVVDNSAELAAAAKKEEDARKAKEAKEAKQDQDAENARKKQEADDAKKAETAAKSSQPAPATNDYNDAMMKSKAGLVFRVQIAAGPNKVDPSFFQTKYGISDAVVIEEHDGLFKYVVGEFGSYRPAKTFSNELRDNNSVEGPFVTAYNNGTRIHVKEALDIAGQ